MQESKITSKGQTTIPVEIRAFLGVKPGDSVQYIKTEDGKIELAPRKRYTWQDLMHIMPKAKKALTIEEMNQGIIDAVVEKYERSLPKKKKISKK